MLPSFIYLPHPDELKPGDLTLPWPSPPGRVLGELARKQGASTPIRLVSSAKSWLCHPDVDRKAPILPPEVPDEIPQISPFDASIAYLTHLREAWNGLHGHDPLADQDVTVTVPASFDPAARELTAEAARPSASSIWCCWRSRRRPSTAGSTTARAAGATRSRSATSSWSSMSAAAPRTCR
jgi:molecular chaperone DnaK (HSP70)